jgi:hypothetical protein
MKRSYFVLSALCLALAVSLAVLPLSAADKPDRLTGSVKMINKDSSTITIRPRNTANQRIIVYSADTKITLRGKASSMDQVKEGRRVICLGKFDDKNRLVANHIDIRTE